MVCSVLLILASCGHPSDSGSPDSEAPPDTDVDSGEIDTGDPHPDGLSGPARVAVPFVTVGDPAPAVDIAIESSANASWSLEIQGPFTVTGDTDPLQAGVSRTLTVTYVGATSDPGMWTGQAEFTAGAEVLLVDLAAVVGDEDLGAADWEVTDWGAQVVVDLPSAPNAGGATSWHDDSVLIVVPPGFSDRGVNAITHFHGHGATLLDTVGYQHIIEQSAMSGRDAVLIVPQGPVEASSGDFGNLMDAGGHERLVRDVIAVLYRDGKVTWPVYGDQVLTSHSGGYQATATVIEQGGLPIRAVHLFDSMYAYESTFEDFARDGGTLRSSYTSGGGTDDNNLSVRADLDDVDLGQTFDDDALQAHADTIGYVRSAHGDCLHDDRHYARWLAASGLPRGLAGAPELRSVVREGDQNRVRWLPEIGDGGMRISVQGSFDGVEWDDLGSSEAESALVNTTPYVRIVAIDGVISAPSDVYGAAGDARWLVVDGFDRVFGGSYRRTEHDFAAKVGNALGVPFATASNEAVAAGEIELGDFDHVLWLLGDESTGDQTFDAAEQAALSDYVDGGGALIVSGSEVGYATSSSFLSGTLHCGYASDDAGTLTAGGFTFGVAYDEDYPDVLTGSSTKWTYSTGGAAAVVWNGQVGVIGFPVETIEPGELDEAMAEVRSWVE